MNIWICHRHDKLRLLSLISKKRVIGIKMPSSTKDNNACSKYTICHQYILSNKIHYDLVMNESEVLEPTSSTALERNTPRQN